MIKRVTVYSLLEGTDPDEFWKYHQEVHAPDFVKLAGPGLKRYVIHRVTKVIRGEPKFFGFVETWWESEKAMEWSAENVKAHKTAEGKTILEDFFSRITDGFMVQVEERVIVP